MAIIFDKQGTQILKVECTDIGVLFCKHGAFIGGEALGGRNFDFSDVIIGADKNILKGAIKHIGRKVTGEDIHLAKCTFKGKSVTYFADNCRNVSIVKLKKGSQITIQSTYLLAFTGDCEQSLRFSGKGALTGAGFVATTLKGKGDSAYVAITSSGNTVTLSNEKSTNTLFADPQALVCWTGADPDVVVDFDPKMLIGKTSGESYMFAWQPDKPASIVIQPFEGDVDSMVPETGASVPDSAEAISDVTKGVAKVVAGI